MTVASLLQGVAIILVPLVGLGSDQVTKALRPDHNIEAYHVDEFKRADGTKLRNRMRDISDDEILVSTQILYMPLALFRKICHGGRHCVTSRGEISSLFYVFTKHTRLNNQDGAFVLSLDWRWRI